MTRSPLLLGLLSMQLTMAAAQQPASTGARLGTTTAAFVSRASTAGAALDSDRLKGGGIDDTAVLQAVLDRAAGGRPVHLLIDGIALVSGLTVYGSTTIECVNAGGLYLKDGSSRAIIRNAHRSRDAIVDQHIVVRGCFLNGNRAKQPGASPDSFTNNKEADGTWITGLQFLGVNDLTIENVTLWNVRSFGSWIGNANRVSITDVTVDHGASFEEVSLKGFANTDGLNFYGPLRYLSIDGVKLRTGDDGLAFIADCVPEYGCETGGPFAGKGPITDVTVNNVQLMDSVPGIRFLSGFERIDRVIISNVAGTLTGNYLVSISHWANPEKHGNIGAITITDVQVDRTKPHAKLATELAALVRGLKDSASAGGMYEEFNAGIVPLININAHIENLSLLNIRTAVSDDRPILRFGAQSRVQSALAELNIQDPPLQAVPIELDAGSRVDRLNLSLNWQGAELDEGKNPIVSHDGAIGLLNWMQTPPMYVHAALSSDNSIDVTFSQEVKAADLKAGVTVEVNGKSIAIASASRLPGRGDNVRYVLTKRVGPNDRVTWAYDARQGALQNMNGSHLASVRPKAAGNR